MLRYDNTDRRRGSILPLTAVSLVALMGLIALGIDLGMLAVARTQCQNAADLAALAGTRLLNGNSPNNNLTAAQNFATSSASANSVLSVPLTSSQITVTTGVYRYSTTSQQFAADFSGTKGANESWTAMQVQVNTLQPTYFAQVFGINPIAVSSLAVAVHRPRDVAIVLDFSTSMQYGSNVNVRDAQENATPTNPTAGSMNPDPVYPQFGPWSVFQSSAVSPGNPNPMMCLDGYGDKDGEAHAPCNLTMATSNGPPMVGDYLCSSGGYVNAFVVGNPSSYSASLTPVVTPTPSTWADWTTDPNAGDQWPLKYGQTAPSGSPSVPSDYAGCVQDYLKPGSPSPDGNFDDGAGGTKGGAGYDYNPTTKKTTPGTFKGYTMGPGYYGKTFYMWPPDPRTPAGSPGQGGYVPGDWRQRYFGTNDNTTLWNSNSSGNTVGQWINQSNGGTINYANVLAWIQSGPQTLPPNLQSGRIVYYSTIPSDVSNYAGNPDQRFWREYIDFVLGYNSETTNYNPTSNLYGQNNPGNPASARAFQAPFNQPNGGNGFNSLTFGPSPSITGPPANKAYMSYTDAPIHPRLHFWFGPLTMMAFLVSTPEYGRNWNPGTSHEAHDWQLKAGIQSAIQDFQSNHPNDQASLIYFSTLNAYAKSRVPMGQNYTYLTNALWYPYSLISPADGSVSGTIRPYNNNFSDNTSGNVPTANGGTDSSGGLAVAYNEFSSAAGYNGRCGAVKMVILETDGVTHDWVTYTFQNSGAWNSYYQNLSCGNDEGVNSNPNSKSKQVTYQVAAQLTASTTPPSGPPGYSTARQPARIHCLAFGQLMEPSMSGNATAGPMQACVLQFLLQIQQNGNTSPMTDTVASCWGTGTPTSGGDGITPPSGGWNGGTQSFKIIVGGYQQRINLIQQAMSRIMQSGVQISLID